MNIIHLTKCGVQVIKNTGEKAGEGLMEGIGTLSWGWSLKCLLKDERDLDRNKEQVEPEKMNRCWEQGRSLGEEAR